MLEETGKKIQKTERQEGIGAKMRKEKRGKNSFASFNVILNDVAMS